MYHYPSYKHAMSLNGATSTGAGASLGGVDTPVAGQSTPRSPSKLYTVLIQGGPSATVVAQGMMLNGTWVTMQSFTLSGTDVYASFAASVVDFRLNVTAYTSGTINGFISAL